MKNIKLLVITLFFLLLSGCDNKGELKQVLQEEYDRLNETGFRAFCYYIGDVRFPYTEEIISTDDNHSIILNKKELAIRLPLFARLGLLHKELANDALSLYRYDLTEEGKKYLYTYNRSLPKRIKYENYFCYGRRVLQEVTDIKDATHKGYSGEKYTTSTISYIYILENLSEWGKSKDLHEIYQSTNLSSYNTLRGSAYLKKEKGDYYLTGFSNVSTKDIGYY